MSSMIPNPMTSPQPTGMVSAPPTDDPNFQVPGVPAFGVPQQYMLPGFDRSVQGGAPMGAFTDATYLSSEAALRADIASKYQNVLQQLGYQDPTSGATVPGRVAQDANIQLAQYQHDLQQAAMSVTRQSQQNGTVFSGIRGQQLADAQYPTVQAEGALGLNTARSLSDLYNTAQGLVSGYNTQNNQLLAAAAARQAAALTANPPASITNIYGSNPGLAPSAGPAATDASNSGPSPVPVIPQTVSGSGAWNPPHAAPFANPDLLSGLAAAFHASSGIPQTVSGSGAFQLPAAPVTHTSSASVARNAA